MWFKSNQWAVLLLSAVQLLQTSTAIPLSGDRASLLKRDSTPGIGFELEAGSILLENNAITYTNDAAGDKAKENDLLKIKGAIIAEAQDKVVGWSRTAETTTSNDIQKLNVEWIVDGLVVKLGKQNGQGQTMLQAAAQGVVNDLSTWKPNKQSQPVSIAGFEDKGKWSITAPNSFSTTLSLSQQITVPLPLESIPDLALKARNPESDAPANVFAATVQPSKKSRLFAVERAMFEDQTLNMDGHTITVKADPDLKKLNLDVTDDLLGFLTLVVSYAKYANQGYTKGQSAKAINFLMPRTDFVTMYSMVSCHLRGAKLYDIVKTLSKYSGAGTYLSDGEHPDNSQANLLDTQSFLYQDGDLLVSDWINGFTKATNPVDLLAQKDKQVDNQIGKLGSRTESLLNNPNAPNKQVPIFELRDMGSSMAGSLLTAVKRFEDQVVTMHKNYPKAPATGTRRWLSGRSDNVCVLGPKPSSSTSSQSSSSTGTQSSTSSGSSSSTGTLASTSATSTGSVASSVSVSSTVSPTASSSVSSSASTTGSASSTMATSTIKSSATSSATKSATSSSSVAITSTTSAATSKTTATSSFQSTSSAKPTTSSKPTSSTQPTTVAKPTTTSTPPAKPTTTSKAVKTTPAKATPTPKKCPKGKKKC